MSTTQAEPAEAGFATTPAGVETGVDAGVDTVVADSEPEEPETGTVEGEDLEKGKLFDVPRVGVIVDDSDPTVLKVALSGSVVIDRDDEKGVRFYNSLRAGHPVELKVAAHVAGSKNVHRRDGEGDVDAVVQTKSLVIDEIVQ
jgi:hypothetical protein